MMMSTTHMKTARDLLILGRFIQVYCDGHHRHELREAADLKFCRVEDLLGKAPVLCEACSKLLAHAFFKRLHCPMNPKPACKHCPDHCYHANYRQEIRQVMRYSGWALIRRGRLDLLWHMFF